MDDVFPSEMVMDEYPMGLEAEEVPPGMEDEDESSSSEEDFVPFPDLEEEAEELGEAQRRTICFGCRYVGEANGPALQHEELKHVFETWKEGVGRTDPIALAVEVHELYEGVRAKVNASKHRGRDLLPEWKAATILKHFRDHNTDPQMQRWLQVDRVQKVMRLIENESMVKINRRTGKRRIDKEQWNIHKEASIRWERLMSKDIAKMAYFDDESHIKEPKGIIHMGEKRVYQFFKRQRRNE